MPGAPIRRLLGPFQLFVQAEAFSGILLLGCVIAALIWANSPWSDQYFDLWETQVSLGIAGFHLEEPVIFWINDGLMAIFFFVVGLEIKREFLVGELSSRKQAALPLIAALGGMLVPAAIYLTFNAGGEAITGWGIPMATDIAFVIGILALLGDRIPLALKIFLTALAIVDDIGAVLVIALFYTTDLNMLALAFAAVLFALLILTNRLGVRQSVLYLILGFGMWLAILQSGIHATIAGVLLALTMPSRLPIRSSEFLRTGRSLLDDFEAAGGRRNDILTNQERQTSLHGLERLSRNLEAPLLRFERFLHPWTSYLIVPVFALANAGFAIETELLDSWSDPVVLGIVAGLVMGKQIGIFTFAWLGVRLRLASRWANVSWRHIYGASCVAGIGFTMSLFIALLAFTSPTQLALAKIGILTASVVAGSWGWLFLRAAKPVHPEPAAREEGAA